MIFSFSYVLIDMLWFFNMIIIKKTGDGETELNTI